MKFQLKKPADIDLAAVNKHHVPGTAYHWKHGYIPLDARTAALWHKHSAERHLISQGRLHTPEPETWHSAFGGKKAIESPTASKSNTAIRELDITAVHPKKAETGPDVWASRREQRQAAHDYLAARKTYYNHATGRGASRPTEQHRAMTQQHLRHYEAASERLHKVLPVEGVGPDAKSAGFTPLKMNMTREEMKAAQESRTRWNDYHFAHAAAANKALEGPGQDAEKSGVAKVRRSLDKTGEVRVGDHITPTGNTSHTQTKRFEVTEVHRDGGVTIKNTKTGVTQQVTPEELNHTNHADMGGWSQIEKPKTRVAKKPAAAGAPSGPKTDTEKVFHPEKGDELAKESGPSGDHTYRYTGTKWEAYRSDGSRASKVLDLDRAGMLRRAENGYIRGATPESVSAYKGSDAHIERVNAESLAASQKVFGKDKVHGFRAVSAMDVHKAEARRISPEVTDEQATKFARQMLAAGATSPSVMHDDGTMIHFNAPTTRAQAQAFAGHIETVTRRTEHLVGEHNGGRISYHVDPQYSGGKRWGGKGGTTLAYVHGGNKSDVHVNPVVAKGQFEGSSSIGGHWLEGSGNEHITQSIITHELGHIHHNRTGNFSYGDTPGIHEHIHRDLEQFHKETYRDTPGAAYGKKNNREGYAEAFAHHVNVTHNEEAAARWKGKKRVSGGTPVWGAGLAIDRGVRMEKHDEVAKRYAEKFGWIKAAKGQTA